MKIAAELQAASERVRRLQPRFKLGDLVRVRGNLMDGEVGVVIDVGVDSKDYPDYVRATFGKVTYIVYFPDKDDVDGSIYWNEEFFSEADLEAVKEVEEVAA